MQAFQLENLLTEHQAAGKLYHEFLRVPTLSMGLYILKAGSDDPQQPHEEDEVYYVLQGQAKFTCEGQEVEARAGSVLFVAAHDPHKFHHITEDLHLLVFFAPPESTPTS